MLSLWRLLYAPGAHDILASSGAIPLLLDAAELPSRTPHTEATRRAAVATLCLLFAQPHLLAPLVEAKVRG